MKNNLIIGVIVALVIGGAVGFFGGMQYQKSQPVTFGNGQFRGNGQFQGRAGTNGTRPVSGDIISSDASSVTVKLSDGSTKIVILSSTTAINKAAAGTKADLKPGEKIAAFGTTNSDGSITAQSIQLNPVSRGGMMGGAPKQ